MRRGRARLSAILALAGVLVAGSAGADSILEFDIWMQKIDRHSQTILHALKRQDVSAAVADARELERLYGQMERFYEARGEHDDPLLLSWDGRQRAASAAVQAQQGDFAGAFESAVGIARDCRACHDRFKPIKPQG
ncbi:hypothetical protein [Zoogloea dura]|uniref:Cytochrome c n=1 Tax=Zoogloea dura TaxID=2728840 RepID=A0A848G0S7_9RHOO|nr:hypothetical protein [Zoogloea dura]NML24696.1 hypothetical protein [Zoogloea dura]